jgi:transcriptional regulator with XRE-family HTH domain
MPTDPMAARLELGDLLRELRDKTGLKLETVARRLKEEANVTRGGSKSTYQRIERGEAKTTRQVLEAILAVLGANEEETDRALLLLQWTEHPRRVPAPPASPLTEPTSAMTRTAATDDTGQPAVPRTRWVFRPRRWKRIAGGVVVLGLVVAGYFTRSGNEDRGVADMPSPVPSRSPQSGSPGGNVPCEPPPTNTPRSSREPGEPPTLRTQGDAGRVQLIDHEVTIFDARGDGCAIILFVRIDGSEIKTLFNATGKTGGLVDGKPRPPVHGSISADDDAKIEFRLCVGERKSGVPVYNEPDCTSWVSMN